MPIGAKRSCPVYTSLPPALTTSYIKMPIEVGALPLSTQLFINNEFVDAKSGTKVRAATAPCEHLRRVDTCLPPLTTCRGAVLALATCVSGVSPIDNQFNKFRL